jgi:hypothetical protein
MISLWAHPRCNKSVPLRTPRMIRPLRAVANDAGQLMLSKSAHAGCAKAATLEPVRVARNLAQMTFGIWTRRSPSRANAEINFRNGGSAEGSLARRGGRPIPKKGWDPFFPPRLALLPQHSQRPLASAIWKSLSAWKDVELSSGASPSRERLFLQSACKPGASSISEIYFAGGWHNSLYNDPSTRPKRAQERQAPLLAWVEKRVFCQAAPAGARGKGR